MAPAAYGATATVAPLAQKPTSLTSNIRGRTAVLTSWMVAKPFVSSFIEDEIQGTARRTRSNTLLNRNASDNNLAAITTTTPSSPSSSSPSPPSSRSSTPPQSPRKTATLSIRQKHRDQQQHQPRPRRTASTGKPTAVKSSVRRVVSTPRALNTLAKSPSTSSSSAASSTNSITFADEVKAYFPQTKEGKPVIEAIRGEPKPVLQSSRTMHPTRQQVDPSQPLSQGGKWLNRALAN